MEYCRKIKFEGDPDYDYCINLFDKCMQKGGMDPKVFDYTWKQNQAAKEKVRYLKEKTY